MTERQVNEWQPLRDYLHEKTGWHVTDETLMEIRRLAAPTPAPQVEADVCPCGGISGASFEDGRCDFCQKTPEEAREWAAAPQAEDCSDDITPDAAAEIQRRADKYRSDAPQAEAVERAAEAIFEALAPDYKTWDELYPSEYEKWRCAARAALAAATPDRWQPIDTAPKAGTHFLAWKADSGPYECCWENAATDDYPGGWVNYHADADVSPTHWLPGWLFSENAPPAAPTPAPQAEAAGPAQDSTLTWLRKLNGDLVDLLELASKREADLTAKANIAYSMFLDAEKEIASQPPSDADGPAQPRSTGIDPEMVKRHADKLDELATHGNDNLGMCRVAPSTLRDAANLLRALLPGDRP